MTSLKIEQLFAGDTMLTEARWPNCAADKMLMRDGWRRVRILRRTITVCRHGSCDTPRIDFSAEVRP